MTYCDFQTGDQVVCVDVSACDVYGEPGLVLGDLYTVSEVAVARVQGGVAVGLAEIRSGGPLGLFGAFRFRKVQRKNPRLAIEAFMTMPGGFEEPKRAPAKETA